VIHTPLDTFSFHSTSTLSSGINFPLIEPADSLREYLYDISPVVNEIDGAIELTSSISTLTDRIGLFSTVLYAKSVVILSLVTLVLIS